MSSRVSIVKCGSYDPVLVQEAVNKSIDLLGGIAAFIKPQSRVLVKPNLLMAAAPEAAITTHPEVIRAVVRQLKDINCKVFLGDGPSVWGGQIEKVEEVYTRTGVRKLCGEEGIELVEFDKKRWHDKIPMTTWLDDTDYLVSIPKFKTHSFTLLSAAVKNLFGLVWETYKTELHKQYYRKEAFAIMLAQVYGKTRPALTVIDGITAMEGEGPGSSGKPKQVGLVFAGEDCVSLDSILAVIMGLDPLGVLTTQESARRGMGKAELKDIEILGEKLESIAVEPFLLPATTLRKKIPQAILEAIRNYIRYYPRVDHGKCTRCGTCVKACPEKIISLNSGKIVINYTDCISCFCCQESCPAAAIEVKKSIIAKLIGL